MGRGNGRVHGKGEGLNVRGLKTETRVIVIGTIQYYIVYIYIYKI